MKMFWHVGSGMVGLEKSSKETNLYDWLGSVGKPNLVNRYHSHSKCHLYN